MQKNEVFEILTDCLVDERLPKIIGHDEKYRAALIHEDETYKKLDATLTDTQKKLFSRWMAASEETIAHVERMVYQQGMKDMYNLLMSLQGKDGS